MPRHLAARKTLRSCILPALSAMLFLSLVCSLSLQRSYAGMPVADSANDVMPLAAGDAAPLFTVMDVDGNAFEFDPESLERPVVIITFRGGWCPYCNLHLSELRTVLPEIQAMDVDVIFLSGDRPAMLYASLSQDTQDDIAGLGYRIFSDANAEAAVALGIAFRAADSTIQRRLEKGQDIDESSMLKHGVLPVPAVYAIDTDGQIRYSFVEPDYKVRLPADEMLAVIRGLVQ